MGTRVLAEASAPHIFTHEPSTPLNTQGVGTRVLAEASARPGGLRLIRLDCSQHQRRRHGAPGGAHVAAPPRHLRHAHGEQGRGSAGALAARARALEGVEGDYWDGARWEYLFAQSMAFGACEAGQTCAVESVRGSISEVSSGFGACDRVQGNAWSFYNDDLCYDWMCTPTGRVEEMCVRNV